MDRFFDLDGSFIIKMLGIYMIAMAAGASFPAHAAWETPNVATTQMAEQQAQPPLPAAGITARLEPFYKITATDAGAAVAKQLQAQGVETKAEATLAPGTPPLLYSSDRKVELSIHSLQVDPQTKRWQAQAYFLSGGKTESVRPIAGTYTPLIDVPVVTRQLSRNDVIEERDLTILPVAERLLRKDAILDKSQLIGQSPRAGISPNRPIHMAEVTAPIVIKRGDLVEMAYNTPYIHIKTTGVALDDGAKGSTIRIKNQKSQLAVSAKVAAAGRVEVGTEGAL